MKRLIAALAGALLIAPACHATEQIYAPLSGSAGMDRAMRAEPREGRWFISPEAGFDVTLGGDFTNKSAAAASGTASLFGQVPAAGTVIRMPGQSFHNAFDTPFHLGAEIGYGLDKGDEVALGLRWLHAGAKTFGAISASDGTALKGRFNEYQEVGVDGIGRHYFSERGQLRPFIALLGGLKYTPDMKLSLFSGGAEVGKIPFYDAGWSWEAGAALGFRWDFNRDMSFGMEARLRYVDKLDRNLGSASDAAGLAGYNRSGQRVDAPMTMRFIARF